jgi:hypothetical protein
MSKYFLSLNQVAEFQGATDAVKKRIIKQQLKPNPFKIQWYQLTRASIRRSIALKGDLQPIFNGIQRLMQKAPSKPRQVSERAVSIEALNRYIQMKLPQLLRDFDYTILKPPVKSIMIEDVEIIVAPDLVIRGEIRGKTVIGGLKIHISKHKPFELKESNLVSSILYKYLAEKVAQEDELVLPELCFALDVFGQRIVNAPKNSNVIIQEVRMICEQVKQFWKAA